MALHIYINVIPTTINLPFPSLFSLVCCYFYSILIILSAYKMLITFFTNIPRRIITLYVTIYSLEGYLTTPIDWLLKTYEGKSKLLKIKCHPFVCFLWWFKDASITNRTRITGFVHMRYRLMFVLS